VTPLKIAGGVEFFDGPEAYAAPLGLKKVIGRIPRLWGALRSNKPVRARSRCFGT